MLGQLLVNFENNQVASCSESHKFDDFRVGDVVKVEIMIDGIRTQMFEGLCMGIKNRRNRSSFLIRRIDGSKVEKNFQRYSPLIKSIKVVKQGSTRRAKMYYVRHTIGKFKVKVKNIK